MTALPQLKRRRKYDATKAIGTIRISSRPPTPEQYARRMAILNEYLTPAPKATP